MTTDTQVDKVYSCDDLQELFEEESQQEGVGIRSKAASAEEEAFIRVYSDAV